MTDRHVQKPYPLRIPAEVRESLELAAKESGRSLNAEIAFRLEESLRPPEPTAQLATERRKLELVTSYLDWCQAKGKVPEKAYTEFCDFYNNPQREHDGIDSVSGIVSINRDYLSELYSVWFLERDARYPHQGADLRHIIKAIEVQMERREQALLHQVELIAKHTINKP